MFTALVYKLQKLRQLLVKLANKSFDIYEINFFPRSHTKARCACNVCIIATESELQQVQTHRREDVTNVTKTPPGDCSFLIRDAVLEYPAALCPLHV